MTEPSPLQRVGLSSGYLLTGLLVLAAAAILAWPLLDTGPAAKKGGAPAVTPGASQHQPAQQQPAPQETVPINPNPGVNGAGPCGTQSVSWQEAGAGITVTVVYLGVGNVTATIVPNQGDQVEKHYSTAMDATPHVFTFDLPASAVKRVGLSVVTQADGVMKNCDVSRS
jgi:hypothetical protein